MVTSLYLLLAGHRHVVAQIVEAELIVCSVSDVSVVLGSLVGAVAITSKDETHLKTQPAVNLAHPLGITPGEIIIDGYDVDTLAGDAIEIDRQGRREGLALACLHFGDPPEVKGRAANQLFVIMTLAQHALGCFAHNGERLDQQIVRLFALIESRTEFTCLGLERVVAQHLDLGFHRVDIGDQCLEGLELAPFTTSEDLTKKTHN